MDSYNRLEQEISQLRLWKEHNDRQVAAMRKKIAILKDKNNLSSRDFELLEMHKLVEFDQLADSAEKLLQKKIRELQELRLSLGLE